MSGRRWRNAFVALAGVAAPSFVAALWHGELPRSSYAVSPAPGRIVPRTETVDGAPGRWGQLEYSRIAISIPAELVDADFPTQPPRWWFKRSSRPQVEALFASAGVSTAPGSALTASRWEPASEGSVLLPAPELILGLDPASRATIYGALAPYEENVPQHSPELYYPEHIDDRIESSGLSESSVALFKRMLYPGGRWLLFADKNAVLARIGDRKEKTRFLQATYRKVTYLVELKVDRRSDLAALEEYWSYPGRPSGLRELLDSVAREPGGGRLDLAHLLPPFARKRIYTFGESSGDSAARRHDCGWTAFNFFEDTPDDRFTDGEFARKTLESRYREVTDPAFGDLVILLDDKDATVHLANYIAEDLVFTKNGVAVTQPWMFMKMDQLRDMYSVGRPPGDPVRIHFFHRQVP